MITEKDILVLEKKINYLEGSVRMLCQDTATYYNLLKDIQLMNYNTLTPDSYRKIETALRDIRDHHYI